MKNLKTAVLASVIASVSMGAMAYEKGDLILRAGVANIDPHDSSSLISVAGLGGPVANTGVGIAGDTQLGLTGTYMLTDRVGLELLASSPFTHSISAQGIEAFGVTDIGDVTHLPPTLSVQYFLNSNTKSMFQPYVGVGVNYTIILDEDLSSEMKTNLGATSMDVDNSIGLTAEIGIDVALSDKWGWNAAIWYMDIETSAQIDSAVGSIDVDLDIDPWVYMVSATYKF
jgi:outer membrane protein